MGLLLRLYEKLVGEEPEGFGKYDFRNPLGYEMSMAEDSGISVPSPSGLEYRGFQKAGIEFCATRNHVLLADEPGLGKTIEVIGTMNYLGDIKRCLVICPATLKINWRREFDKWLIDKDTNVTISSYEKLNEVKLDQPWDLVVADESHRIKNPGARRTKLSFYAMQHAERRMFVTGSPILNRPVELFWPLKMMEVPFAQNYHRFIKRYCMGHRTRWGIYDQGASNLDELRVKLRESVMIRRLKKDVLKDLPPKQRQIIRFEPLDNMLDSLREEKDMWDRYQKNLSTVENTILNARTIDEYLDAVENLGEYEKVEFDRMSSKRKESAIKKVPLVVQHLENYLECTDKIIVFAHHKEVIKKIKDKFSNISVSLQGGDSDSKKQNAIDQFQNNPDVKLFVGSIEAAGLGVTLTAASLIVFAELHWVPEIVTQAEDRAHRIGQKKSLNIQHLVVDESFDCRLAEAIINKQDVISTSLDGNNSQRVF